MASGFEVTGSQSLSSLARRLRSVDVGKTANRYAAGSARKAVPAVRKGAGRLPGTGGLAARVASQNYQVSSTHDGARISGRGMQELALIDSGQVNRPVFNQRDNWIRQDVEPGFFSESLMGQASIYRRGYDDAIAEVKRQITRRF